MNKIQSDLPKVVLTKAFLKPFENAVATARTCYSSRIIFDEEISMNEKACLLRDKIAQSTYKAGHHTTLQHAHFQFAISNISRHSLWSFFHAHPFYNSEQVSQRYVPVKGDGYIVPDFGNSAMNDRYIGAIKRQKDAYQQLSVLLHPVCEELYFGIFKGRQKNADSQVWQNAIKKRCQEVARYILPIGTHAHLYHTISGLTLLRYLRLSESVDCPLEQKLVVNAMYEEVNKLDPLFFSNMEGALSLEETFEYKALQKNNIEPINSKNAHKMASEFDNDLGGLTSKLVSASQNPDGLIADAVRHMLNISSSNLNNDQAISLVMSPKENGYLGESMNLLSLSKISKALDLVYFTFKKKLSHSADSQAQRHRMLSGMRPVFSRGIDLEDVDYITPKLFEHEKAIEAKRLYDEVHSQTLEDISWLHKNNADAEWIQYLLTNAHPIRCIETGSLMDFLHKWRSRLCYNAQEEIWQSTKEEVLQVIKLAPKIGQYIFPPCTSRKLAGASPICPEGDRYCGIPVWKLEINDYQRTL